MYSKSIYRPLFYPFRYPFENQIILCFPNPHYMQATPKFMTLHTMRIYLIKIIDLYQGGGDNGLQIKIIPKFKNLLFHSLAQYLWEVKLNLYFKLRTFTLRRNRLIYRPFSYPIRSWYLRSHKAYNGHS